MSFVKSFIRRIHLFSWHETSKRSTFPDKQCKLILPLRYLLHAHHAWDTLTSLLNKALFLTYKVYVPSASDLTRFLLWTIAQGSHWRKDYARAAVLTEAASPFTSLTISREYNCWSNIWMARLNETTLTSVFSHSVEV